MKRLLFVIPAVCLVVALAGCPMPGPEGRFDFTSADLNGGFNGGGDWLFPGASPELADDETGADPPAEERSVVEPDVIRRAGNLLYVLNQYRGLVIVDLDTEEILARVPVYGFPRDLYVENGRAYVLVANAAGATVDAGRPAFDDDLFSRLYIVDVSTPALAGVLSSIDLTGDLVDSRLVGSVLYTVTAERSWYALPWGPEPGFAEGEDGVAVSRAKDGPQDDAWVTSVDVSDPNDITVADALHYEGGGHVIQATASAIFVASDDGNATSIQYVDISDPGGVMALRGTAQVPGYVADRFKMDAYDGVLRVVSNALGNDRQTFLTTFELSNPDALAQLGQLEFETARGDALFATRFDGDRAYVVTYFITDPLYVVDLSDPTDPAITGELEVPGWSTHIEPRGGVLIALGVDDTNGNQVSVSLFDVSNPAAPSLIERESFGEQWSWSSAYDDVKAFSVFDDLLIVPFGGWSEHGGYERLQFVPWDATGLEVQGAIDLSGHLVRSFQYLEAYYALTQEELVTIDASDVANPQVTNRLRLAEYVTDFVPLASGNAAQVITRPETVVSVVDPSQAGMPALGEVTVTGMTQLLDVLAYGNSVVLVGTKADNDWAWGEDYTVALVDCTTPAAPTLTGPVALDDISPVYGYWGFPVMPMDGPLAADIAYGPWWPGTAQDTAFLAGDTLALRCLADSWTATAGDATPDEGVAVLSLPSLTLERTIGLGYDRVTAAMMADNGDFVVTIAEYAGEQGVFGAPLLAYLVTLVDLNAATAGPLVNVPGEPLQYDGAEDLLVLHDYQWAPGGEYEAFLRTVRWSGGDTASVLDSEELPPGASQLLARGDRVYFDAWDEGYRVYQARIAPAGALVLGDSVEVEDGWGRLLEARGDTAYLSVNEAAVAVYGFTGGGTLKDLAPVMAAPETIRFGAANAYAALGYSGVLTLPL